MRFRKHASLRSLSGNSWERGQENSLSRAAASRATPPRSPGFLPLLLIDRERLRGDLIVHSEEPGLTMRSPTMRRGRRPFCVPQVTPLPTKGALVRRALDFMYVSRVRVAESAPGGFWVINQRQRHSRQGQQNQPLFRLFSSYYNQRHLASRGAEACIPASRGYLHVC
ncbi:hypothetical protein SKAU_G00303620 [Synaphobranchus kaupii]|uniref:Uncharacterized protein n=1 Tax=Synaphobranchus kaupii TaxID=118154 RepID=A0A9Q1IN97_SYNKA|nr:hypothetical protein SKAU_G00303620 [Synaphobranchus kaupii]